MSGKLSQVVVGAAAKRLTAVEALPSRSNQHEFNGVQKIRQIFGAERQTFPARFIYLADDETALVHAQGFVTWYDAREEHPTRSEYRLYFPKTDTSELLQEGDLALVLRRPEDKVLIAFAAQGSTAEQQLLWLFGLQSPRHELVVKDLRRSDAEAGFAAREVLSELGIELDVAPASEESYLEVLLDRFGEAFPTTSEFSDFARGSTPDAEPVEDPDGTLIAWLEREEALFRQLERHLVLKRLRQGFGDDVDGFIEFSLSVQNRRKSRIGHALENHIEAVLRENKIQHSRGQITERSSRPDFVFPSIEAYRDSTFAQTRLVVLAAKSTCKDRWRQVLSEADRVRTKYLLTLEPGISRSQTQEMAIQGVRLVIPFPLQESFTPEQRSQLLTLKQFLAILRDGNEASSSAPSVSLPDAVLEDREGNS